MNFTQYLHLGCIIVLLVMMLCNYTIITSFNKPYDPGGNLLDDVSQVEINSDNKYEELVLMEPNLCSETGIILGNAYIKITSS